MPQPIPTQKWSIFEPPRDNFCLSPVNCRPWHPSCPFLPCVSHVGKVAPYEYLHLGKQQPKKVWAQSSWDQRILRPVDFESDFNWWTQWWTPPKGRILDWKKMGHTVKRFFYNSKGVNEISWNIAFHRLDCGMSGLAKPSVGWIPVWPCQHVFSYIFDRGKVCWHKPVVCLWLSCKPLSPPYLRSFPEAGARCVVLYSEPEIQKWMDDRLYINA